MDSKLGTLVTVGFQLCFFLVVYLVSKPYENFRQPAGVQNVKEFQ